MLRRVWVLTMLFFLFAYFPLVMAGKSFTPIEARRDQRLFLAASNSIAEGKYAEAKVLLKTLIYTYPDSPLVEQARILVFFSDAREKGQRTEDARRILQQIEAYLNAHHPKP